MAKDVISVDGEDKVVREDTAKSYRGVIWALTSVAIFIAILAVLAVLFFGGSLGGNIDSPGKIESETRR
jgi:hypothetical protein